MYASMIAFLLIIAAIGAGLMAGFYFAFSGFIMRSLDRLDLEGQEQRRRGGNHARERHRATIRVGHPIG